MEAMNAKVDQTSKRVSEWRVGQHVERGGMGPAGAGWPHTVTARPRVETRDRGCETHWSLALRGVSGACFAAFLVPASCVSCIL